MAVITIVGAGMMGSAMAFPAAENGHVVRLTGTHLDREIIETSKRTGRHPKFEKDFPPGVEYHQIEELRAVLADADLLVCGVSSFGVDWFAETVFPHLEETLPMLAVTKGLFDTEEGDLLCYPQYWENKAAPKKLCLNAVGGPCTSYELVAHDQTVVTFCGKELETLERIRALLRTDYYHIDLSTNVIGVETAVALKNAYALGVSLAIGLNEKVNGIDSSEHYNSQAALFGQSVKEMERLLRFIAGKSENAYLGAGDLYVTIFGGRTRLIGTLLGRGLSVDRALAELNGTTLESTVITERMVRAANKLASRGRLDPKQFPLLMHLGDILTKKQPVNIPWDKFTEN